MPPIFDHEKLQVYQLSLKFIAWSSALPPKLKTSSALGKQFDRARASVPLNIAEGNGKFTSADSCRFFDIARGSALECAACLDVALTMGDIAETECAAGKELLRQIVSMLVGLIRSNSPDRLHESPPEYRVAGGSKEQE